MYFDGLSIHASGKYECKSGKVTDGLVCVLSEEQGEINLKREVGDANDHMFVVKGGRMTGHCLQSASTWVLEKDIQHETDSHATVHWSGVPFPLKLLSRFQEDLASKDTFRRSLPVDNVIAGLIPHCVLVLQVQKPVIVPKGLLCP